MLFSSVPFLFYFLPVIMVLYFSVPWKMKNAVLLLASLFFYAWGEPRYVFLMLASILLGYVFGIMIGSAGSARRKKVYLILSVVSGAAILSYYKYADFFIENFNAVTGIGIPALKIALPIGISFYTFQVMSYTIDVYRGNTGAQKNFISFAAYVAMFPQLIAGPIVRYVDIAAQLEDKKRITAEKIYTGVCRFVVGLSKKVLIANALGELCEIFRQSQEKSVLFYWIYAVSFTLHIYFDFSGYSDMAIGLGKIFGFDFLENFNYPYVSKSITEFWRRWHMSLGAWFRDYVYIPLGGNRAGAGRQIFNILVVWMLTGFWHGAAWNFVLWGLMFAVLLITEKFLLKNVLEKMPSWTRHIYVMFFVILSFVLFNAQSLPQAAGDIKGIFGFGGLAWVTSETFYYLKSYGVVIALGIIGTLPLCRNIIKRIKNNEKLGAIRPLGEAVILIVQVIMITAYLVDGSFNPFLYFRF